MIGSPLRKISRRLTATAFCLFGLALSSLAAPPANLSLSPERQKVVDASMNVLLSDARNDFAFRQVYDAFKAEKKEYLLLDYFKKLLQLKREQPETAANLHLILGRLYEAFRDPFQAGMEYREAVKLTPERAYPHYLLAEIRARQREHTDAVAEYGKAVGYATDMDERVRAWYGLAAVQTAQRRWDEARKTWNNITEHRPYDAETHRRLAESVDDIIRADERAQARMPGLASTGRLDAATLDMLWGQCEKWRLQVVKLVEEDAELKCEALLALADLRMRHRQFEAAEKDLRQARDLLSESHWLMSEINARIRQCLTETKRLDAAATELAGRAGALHQAMESRLELVGILEDRAAGLTGAPAREVYRAAAEQWRLVCELSPRDVQFLERYRAALVQLEDDAGVETASLRLVALCPENVHYKLDLAGYYVARNRMEKAKGIWDAVIAEGSSQPVRRLAVARAMRRADKLDWAEEQYRRLVEIATDASYRIELAGLLLSRAAALPTPEPAKPAAAPPAAGARKPAPDKAAEEVARRWQAEREKTFARVRELLLPMANAARLSLAETQEVAILLLDNRLLPEAETVLESARKRFPKDMRLATMLGEASLRLAAAEKDNAKRDACYDKAVNTCLEAYDLAPHPAIQFEMNSELLSLCLAYGGWEDPNTGKPLKDGAGRALRGGVRGVYPLMAKHLKDFFAQPENPMPAWCIGDLQQQLPETYYGFSKPRYPFLPDATMGFYCGADRGRAGLDFFNYALDRDPLLLAAYESKSTAYATRDSFEQAVVELRKLTVIDPVSQWKYFLRIGDLFANQGQMEEAVAFWDRVAERVFSDATMFYQLSCRYFRAEKPDLAIAVLERAVRTNPNIAAYHITLGNMYDYTAQYQRAADAYMRALELSSQSMLLPLRQRLADILRSCAEQLFAEGKHDQALDHFRKIRAFQDVLQRFYQKEDDRRALAALSPEIADTAVQIARCQEALGNKAEADKLYGIVRAESPLAPIRLTRDRTMTSRYLLALRDAGTPLGDDHRGPAGETPASSFRLNLLHHTKVWDITHEHSITPNGVLFHGLREWTEVDPLTGQVLRSERADKMIRHRDGIEVRVRRNGEKKSDVVEIIRQASSVSFPLPDRTTARVADLRIGDGLVYFQTVGGAAPAKVLAVDAATGLQAWASNEATDDLYAAGPFVVGMKYRLDQTTLVVLDARTGNLLLKKDLAAEGIWLEPAAWGNKLFLVDDVRWQLKLLDVATGEWDYEHQFRATFPVGPVLRDGVLYVHERDYKGRTIHLHAMDPATGAIRWSCDMKAMSVHSPPVFRDDDIVYLNPETHTIFMIDRRTGVRHAEAGYEKLLTKQQLDRIQFVRAFGRRLLLVGTYGDIHALEIVPEK